MSVETDIPPVDESRHEYYKTSSKAVEAYRSSDFDPGRWHRHGSSGSDSLIGATREHYLGVGVNPSLLSMAASPVKALPSYLHPSTINQHLDNNRHENPASKLGNFVNNFPDNYMSSTTRFHALTATPNSSIPTSWGEMPLTSNLLTNGVNPLQSSVMSNGSPPGSMPSHGTSMSPSMGDRSPRKMSYTTNDGEISSLYFCHLCSFSASIKEEFTRHMNSHFEHNCPHCDYTSRTEGRLKRHIKDFHSDDSFQRTMPGRPKAFRCKQCEYVTQDKTEFWQHARVHIKDDKLLQCPKCAFVTEYKHHLEYHLRNHFGSKPFKCPKCNYACVNKSMLNSHMKSHTNVYQYRCAECTYATKYCHSLKLHLKKYNHKPATVLNADGSLPQGFDAETSGLSLLTKRGPPRGPRGPRKDKYDMYLNSLLSMPPHTSLAAATATPHIALNGGMISPYWPLFGHFPNGFHQQSSQMLALPKSSHDPDSPRPRSNSDGTPISPFSSPISSKYYSYLQQHLSHHQYKQEPQDSLYSPPLRPNDRKMSSSSSSSPPPAPNTPHANDIHAKDYSSPNHRPLLNRSTSEGSHGLDLRNAGSDPPPRCVLCGFFAASTDDLSSHMIKVHAFEKQDLFRMFGLSTEALIAERQHMRHGQTTPDRSRYDYGSHNGFKEESRYSDDDDIYPDDDADEMSYDRDDCKSIKMTPKKVGSLHVETEDIERSKSMPHSWPNENISSHLKLSEQNIFKSMPNLIMSSKCDEAEGDPMTTHVLSSSSANQSPNILHQMTMRFGETEEKSCAADTKSSAPPMREAPLDLTKPKDSSYDLLHRDSFTCWQERNLQQTDTGNGMPRGFSAKRKLQDFGSDEDEVKIYANSQFDDMAVSPSPRKRSRKGKAYKLNTSGWKSQQAQEDDKKHGHQKENGNGTHHLGVSNEATTQEGSYSSGKDADTDGSVSDENITEHVSSSKQAHSIIGTEDHNTISVRSHDRPLALSSADQDTLAQIHKNLNILNEEMQNKEIGRQSASHTQDTDKVVNTESDQNTENPAMLKSIFLEAKTSPVAAVRRAAEVAWKMMNPEQDSHSNVHHQHHSGTNSSTRLEEQKTKESLSHLEKSLHNSECQPMTPVLNGFRDVSLGRKTIDNDITQKNGDDYECSYCMISFRDCVMYTMHMGYHGYRDPYKCNMCGHQTSNRVEFFLHIARAAHA